MNYPTIFHKPGIRLGRKNNVALTEIILCEGDGNYTHVHFVDRPKLTLSVTLGILHERLGEGQFLRINRSTLVNRDCIVCYEGHEVVLRNGLVIPVARRRREYVERMLEVMEGRRSAIHD